MALLEVDGLVKYFGRRLVVNGVSFSVDPGEVVGLLGPNGAGKTTSFRMATGQIAPNGGRVIFNGEEVTPLPMYQRARRGMGYLSQKPSVFRKLSVEKNLMAILEALPRSRSLERRLTRSERWERTDDALRRFKLEHVRKNTAARCSGGEKRRLEIARCLVCEPLLILLDEPFAAVDPLTTEDIRSNIRDLAKSGIGILITDHNVREVFRSADRVYLITEGKVVTHGTPHELVNDQIAINAYLGRSFEEDGFTRHFATKREMLQPIEGNVDARARDELKRDSWPAANPSSQPSLQTGPSSATTSTKSSAGFPQPSPFPAMTPPPARDLFLAATPAPKFTTQASSGPFAGTVNQLLEQEMLRRAVESLTDPAQMKVATHDLFAKGPTAIPVLLEALERRDPALRQRAFEVLKVIAKSSTPLDYDPESPEDLRLRQVAYLRARLERR